MSEEKHFSSVVQDHLKPLLQKYDKDQNSTLEKEELRTLLADTLGVDVETITQDQIDWHFDRIDENHDGKITFEEYFNHFFLNRAKLARKKQVEVQKKEQKLKEESTEVANQESTGQCRVVTVTQVQTIELPKREPQVAELTVEVKEQSKVESKEQPKVLQKPIQTKKEAVNEDELIDIDEFKRLMEDTFRPLNIKITQDMVQWNFDQIDKDHSGRISFEEFLAFIQKYNK